MEEKKTSEQIYEWLVRLIKLTSPAELQQPALNEAEQAKAEIQELEHKAELYDSIDNRCGSSG